MRIAWIVYGSLDQMTGGYVYDAAIVHGLRARGWDVEVLSLTPRLDESAEWLSRAVLTGKYAAVVGDELCHPELAALFETLKPTKQGDASAPRRCLLVHHLTCWEDGVTRETETRVVKLADQVLVTSPMSAQRLARECGVPSIVCLPGANRLPLGPRGADWDGKRPLRLLFVGTWTERKGLSVLIQALGRLGEANYALRIVGDSERDPVYRAFVESEFQRCPTVIARSERCGVVTNEALAGFYAESDLLVLPSFFEGYGMVLSEALRAGVALVASDVGAIPEVARAGEDARLVPAGDSAALAAVLSELIADPGEVARLQRQARERRFPTWEATVRDFSAALGA
jgi:glycosyltransferase involved in cell wall biosynthesis